MEKPSHFHKPLLVAVSITFLAAILWEIYWRQRDFHISFNDDSHAWAAQRSKVEDHNKRQTVLIGSSRIKFDFDLPTYERMTGITPIQLAFQGTTPVPVLQDLADNTNFTGTLLIGVTDGLFFSPPGSRGEVEIKSRIQTFHRWTLAQRGSFHVGRVLESNLVFLDKERLSLNELLNRLPLPRREGVWVFPVFPLEFVYVTPDRQTKMTDRFLNDPVAQERMKEIWRELGIMNPKPSLEGDALTNFLNTVKGSIDKLRSRGAEVYFIRFPSDGDIWKAEQQAYPRQLFWNRLLEHTQTKGVHFEDYPELVKYRCPEWSHLTPHDGVTFTEDLVKILQEEKGYKVPSANEPH